MVLGVGERNLLCKLLDSGRRLEKFEMQAFLSFYSPPTSSEPTVLLLLEIQKLRANARIFCMVLGVGVEPTKAEAGRFTV